MGTFKYPSSLQGKIIGLISEDGESLFTKIRNGVKGGISVPWLQGHKNLEEPVEARVEGAAPGQ